MKDQCNLVWLENLNLRGSYRAVIVDYIKEKHPELVDLYEEIYSHKSRRYWESLNQQMTAYCQENGLEYVRNDDTMRQPFDAPPVVVNFFYHEEIRTSRKD